MLYTLTFYSFFVVASFGRLCVVVNETNEAKRLDNLCKCAWRQCCWRSAVSDDVLIVYWMKLLIVQCPALKTIILSFDARRLHQKKRWKKKRKSAWSMNYGALWIHFFLYDIDTTLTTVQYTTFMGNSPGLMQILRISSLILCSNFVVICKCSVCASIGINWWGIGGLESSIE